MRTMQEIKADLQKEVVLQDAILQEVEALQFKLSPELVQRTKDSILRVQQLNNEWLQISQAYRDAKVEVARLHSMLFSK